MILLKGKVKPKKISQDKLETLSRNIEKSWDALTVEDLISDEEVAKKIDSISICAKMHNGIPIYEICVDENQEWMENELIQLKNELYFEVTNGFNEFLASTELNDISLSEILTMD